MPRNPVEFDELDYLRHFFRASGDAFGSDDVYDIIAADYEKNVGVVVPHKYNGSGEEEA